MASSGAMMVRSRAIRAIHAAAGLAGVLLSLAACSGDKGPSVPATGTVAISSTVRTTIDNASFMYSITVDQGAPQNLSASSPVSLVIPGLSVGTHTVTLSGLAAGCTVGGAATASRSFTIRGGDTVNVAFDVTCVRTTGDIVVNTTTTGVSLDPDGYSVLVDGAVAGSIAANGTLTVRASQGAHSVALQGVAANCLVRTPPFPSLSVSGGGTATAAFDINCVVATELRFTVTTSGGEPDADGYLIFVDDTQPLRVAPNGVVTIRGIAPGTHTVRLRDIAGNCALTEPGTRQVLLVEGTPLVSTWPVSCLPRGSGTVGFIAVEPAIDTLANGLRNPNPAIDLVSMTGRYSPGWLTLTMRFRAPVTSQVPLVANSLHAFIQLDLDENSLTGSAPSINAVGGNAVQGVDATISTDADPSSALLLRGNVSTGRVGVQYLGDSVVISVPLVLLDNDDGNMTVTATIGTRDRPTDIVPNTGVILARRPPGSIATGAVTMSAIVARDINDGARNAVTGTQRMTLFMPMTPAPIDARKRTGALTAGDVSWLPGILHRE
jgi:hypothetical protein